MKVIIILLCLALQRYANVSDLFGEQGFKVYLRWFKPLFGKLNKWLSLIAVLLPVVVLLFLINELLIWRILGLFSFLFAAFVLFLCMDARDLRKLLKNYFSALDQQNLEQAQHLVKPLADEFELTVPATRKELNRAVTKLIFLKESRQLFMVIFWFAIFGIYGAVVYYMLTLIRKFTLVAEAEYAEISDVAITLQDILDWVPLRLLSLSFALGGHFVRGFSYCIKGCKMKPSENKTFIIDSGLSALDVDIEDTADVSVTENYNALGLIDRGIIIWLVAILFIGIGMLL